MGVRRLLLGDLGMKIIYTDVLVIGGGLAGLRMAVAAKRRGHDSIVLSLVPPKRSHSKAAQGGMQASLGNVIKGMGDNEDIHFADTVRGSDWGADQEVVRMFVNTSPKAVRELAAWGCPWSRITPGDRQVIINGEKVTITERKEAAGLVAQRDFGGTKKWRTCYVSDCTGHAMLNAVSDRIIAEQVPVVERVEALSLIHDGKRCYGAIVRDLITGELLAYVSKATAIATGGAGRIYRVTTNAVICDGTGYDLALGTGVATLSNMEAIQFHPTGIFPAGILVTEGCRGDGGLLRDVDGHRFMPDVEPEKKELASRDVVSRRMEERIAQGKGVKSRFGEHIWLDITLLGEHHIKHNLREVYEICHYFLGVDPTKEWIPVRPAQHYTMGGVRTNYTGESRQLKGLFAAGEASCWDMHGFNRLGGNSVAETVVAGMIVGEFIADFCDKPENGIDIPTSVIYDSIAKVQNELDGFIKNAGTEDMVAIRTRMQDLMTSKIGIFRRGEDMESAVAELEDLLKKTYKVSVKDKAGNNPELVYAYRTRKMLKVALAIACGAAARKESRGAHFREDYPVRNDAEWLCRTIATWKNENDTLPTLSYEKLDVSKMEVGVTYSGTISLSDGQECFNPNTATTSTTVRLAMDYNWVELGEAQWYDGFMLAVSNDNMNIQKCRMTKAEGFEIYRLYNPWPAAEVAEAWGDAMSASNDVPEYLQFTINEDGSIDWRNDVLVYGGQYEFAAVNTGYTYSDWNDDYVWYTSPTEVFGQPDETAVVMENILCFNYGVFSNGSGGSGYVSSSYLALPAFEGNLEDLFQ